ncbi:unnamed protein product [Brassicogethes aeneus]|uniref:Chitin-binding type-2 domain-containing protein n=1 Tax=Brassicogethes aeneus TaxID=1431903 RepID=A0A9P0FLA0_BRAAE|nr:unnamed protein product [Brassicogethes aeneus]
MKFEMTEPTALNVTLNPSERQKRLLPYENYYVSPRQQMKEEQRYPYNNMQYNKYPTEPDQNTLYQQTKFTPFSENNAIPGPFRPMVGSGQPKIEVQFVQLPQELNKVPDYSAIYDKLSQIKLVQRRPTYVQQYRPLTSQRYIQRPKKIHHINVVPIESGYRPRPIQPTKTLVETYTATNIDIPTPEHHYTSQEQHQQQYEQIPNPAPIRVKYQQPQRKPYVQQQDVYNHDGEQLVFVQQNPQIIKEQPPGYLYPEENIDNQPITKPVIYVSRKPNYRPKIVILPEQTHQYENPSQKYAPYIKYLQSPKYEQISPPQKYQYYQQAPQKYQEVPPKYEQEPQKYQKEPLKYEQEPQKYQEQEPVTKYEPVQEEEGYIVPPQMHYEQFPPPPPQKYQEYVPITQAPQITTENSNDLTLILKELQRSNTLPKSITPENIDNSINTLVRILGSLRKQQKVTPKPIVVPDEEYANSQEEHDDGSITTSYPGDTPDGGTPGKAGVDYPALSSIPQTSFNCKTQRYKGFFGDPDTNCQVWHYCDLNGGQASFLCPNGTIFSQVALTCDWWYNVKCATTAQLYVLNERLYKYIIPLTPKFPEDYSGPLVDKYLAIKFQEMEDKMKKEKKGKQQEEDTENESEELQNIEEENEEATTTTSVSTNSNQEKNTLQSVESGAK